jgi:hypothetical protein
MKILNTIAAPVFSRRQQEKMEIGNEDTNEDAAMR